MKVFDFINDNKGTKKMQFYLKLTVAKNMMKN